MPSYKELAEQGIEVEVDALGHCCQAGMPEAPERVQTSPTRE